MPGILKRKKVHCPPDVLPEGKDLVDTLFVKPVT
jgi:hypothetical protein